MFWKYYGDGIGCGGVRPGVSVWLLQSLSMKRPAANLSVSHVQYHVFEKYELLYSLFFDACRLVVRSFLSIASPHGTASTHNGRFVLEEYDFKTEHQLR